MMINKKFLYYVAGFGLMTVLAACGGSNSDDIPDAVEPEPVTPSNPTTPVNTDYNSLGDDFTPHKDGDPYNTYKGLIMCGYQGWFGTPGDGSSLTNNENEAWYHYRENGQFRPGVLRNSIDFWPDCSEYENVYTPGEEYNGKKGYGNASAFVLPNGKSATVFSSYDKQTVLTHFKWMKQYGIDGVYMQRFVGEIQDARHKDHFDTVLDHAMEGSNTYQRAIAVMYDMSGITNASGMNRMVKDAQELMDKYNLKDRSQQKYYLYQNGKPMLALWGVGFNDNGHPKASFLKEYVEKLQEQGWAIMLGCPAYWRAGGNDCVTGAEHTQLINLIKQCDAFIPWYVGRYGYDNFSGSEWQDRIKQDIAEAKKYSKDDHEVIYAVHIYPGGSDRNMHPNNGYPDGDKTNTGYRYGGKFYWNQFYSDIKNGAQAIYVGMFDEIDEGTAIFKQLNVSQVPGNTFDGSDYWVNYTTSGGYSITPSQQTSNTIKWSELASTLNIKFQGIDDDQQTDYYLWMTGQAAKMLNGQIKMTSSIPPR